MEITNRPFRAPCRCVQTEQDKPEPSLEVKDDVTLNASPESAEFQGLEAFAMRLGQLRNKRINNVPLPEEKKENVPVSDPTDQGLANFVAGLGANRIDSGRFEYNEKGELVPKTRTEPKETYGEAGPWGLG